MQGDPRIIDLLNQVLRKELTGINQYFIQRILFLEGVPNLADYDRILVGATPREQMDSDLALEHAALAVLRPGVALSLEVPTTGPATSWSGSSSTRSTTSTGSRPSATRSPRSATSSTCPSRSMRDRPGAAALSHRGAIG